MASLRQALVSSAVLTLGIETSMVEKTVGRYAGALQADVKVPFTYVVVHGSDPTRRTGEQKAYTRTLQLQGMIFETSHIEVEGFHLSFTESSFGRNYLEIVLDLGKRWPPVEVTGQVEWYERRPTPQGYTFIVGISFVDIQADAQTIIRDYLKFIHGMK